MRRYEIIDNKLIMRYSPENWPIQNFLEFIKQTEKNSKLYFHRNTFEIIEKNIQKDDENDDEILVTIGSLRGDYVYLDKEVFRIDHDFAFSKNIKLQDKYFTCGAGSPVSIIKSIVNIVKHNVYIDDETNYLDLVGHMRISDYKHLISKFPNYYELSRYKEKVIWSLIKENFDKLPNYNEKYEKFIAEHRKELFDSNNISINKTFKEAQIVLYEGVIKELKEMLYDDTISEGEWQNKILNILLLLYPKYLKIFSKVQFTSLDKKRELDFIAVDNEGNLDIIEIKKASIGSLLRKNQYRNNFIPTRELEGSIVQCEKYLYLLKANKKDIEKSLNKNYSSNLGQLNIKLINPQAIIIAGRGDMNNELEKEDLEIIRRMHKNIIEIITYDDLIKRLENSIDLLKK